MVKIFVNDRFVGVHRALCDTGSQANLIKRSAIKYLDSETKPLHGSIVGIGANPVRIRRKIRVSIQPWFAEKNENKFDVSFMVLPKSSNWSPIFPNQDVPCEIIAKKLQPNLADPLFWRANGVSLLLGIEFWATAIEGMAFRLSKSVLCQESALGNLILGRINANDCVKQDIIEEKSQIYAVNVSELEKIMKKFWEFEDLPLCTNKSVEDEIVEQMFKEKHFRDESGRHVVSIPMKPMVQELGSSREIALRRFLMQEKRFARDECFRAEYIEKMRENIKNGYMIEASFEPKPGEMVYYIPHHGVHTSNKFRVVFDASCPTKLGISLNDAQFVGPKLQRNLYETFMRFRRHKIAISADIKSMFLQVRINKNQWNLQRIFWRESPKQPLKEYFLVVVTFGLASSPYLAVRSMLEGAASMECSYPEAVHSIRNDFYMDDFTTGASNEEQAIKLAKELKLVLADSGFNLCKWRSNSERLIHELKGEISSTVSFDENDETSVLGLKWITSTDEITYEVREPIMSEQLTKRTILGKIGRLYDPNGFIAPVITLAKILMQELWNSKLGWDEQVPNEIAKQWNALWERILNLEKIRIPRWFGMSNDVQLQLHGFADSSVKCYGCAIYLRIEKLNGESECHLIASKSKVAPIKKVSIPRLELAAAEMLSELFVTVRDAMELQTVPYRLWSDSTTAIQWIHKPLHELKVFVANRVKKIREVSNENDWYHVRTANNPADLISRGLLPSELIKNSLWWNGPKWLSEPQSQWPEPLDIRASPPSIDVQTELKVHSISIQKKKLLVFVPNSLERNVPLIEYSNDLDKLVRILAYVHKFIAICRNKTINKPKRIVHMHNSKDQWHELLPLTSEEERRKALQYFIIEEQRQSFPLEYSHFMKKKENEQSTIFWRKVVW